MFFPRVMITVSHINIVRGNNSINKSLRKNFCLEENMLLKLPPPQLHVSVASDQVLPVVIPMTREVKQHKVSV